MQVAPPGEIVRPIQAVPPRAVIRPIQAVPPGAVLRPIQATPVRAVLRSVQAASLRAPIPPVPPAFPVPRPLMPLMLPRRPVLLAPPHRDPEQGVPPPNYPVPARNPGEAERLWRAHYKRRPLRGELARTTKHLRGTYAKDLETGNWRCLKALQPTGKSRLFIALAFEELCTCLCALADAEKVPWSKELSPSAKHARSSSTTIKRKFRRVKYSEFANNL